MRLRADVCAKMQRAIRPDADCARLLARLSQLKAERGGEDAALAELRWLIEELRVSLFAQNSRPPNRCRRSGFRR